ncbi:MAG: putative quinol monooxygenase [Acidimicrobiia bacterium]
MFTVTVSVRVKPDRREDFLSAITRQAEASRELEPGCLRFEILEDARDPLEFFLIEVYSEPAAFRPTHRETPHYAEWARVADEVLEGERIVNTFTAVRLELDEA